MSEARKPSWVYELGLIAALHSKPKKAIKHHARRLREEQTEATLLVFLDGLLLSSDPVKLVYEFIDT